MLFFKETFMAEDSPHINIPSACQTFEVALVFLVVSVC